MPRATSKFSTSKSIIVHRENEEGRGGVRDEQNNEAHKVHTEETHKERQDIEKEQTSHIAKKPADLDYADWIGQVVSMRSLQSISGYSLWPISYFVLVLLQILY